MSQYMSLYLNSEGKRESTGADHVLLLLVVSNVFHALFQVAVLALQPSCQHDELCYTAQTDTAMRT